MHPQRYERPAVLASYSTEELIREAAACAYESDVALKEDVTPIRASLGGLGHPGSDD